MLVLALALVAGCGGDGDNGGGGGGADEDDTASAGLIIGQQQVDDELTDTLVVIDPERPGNETIDVPGVDRGIPAGPGTALYESDDSIVLVDAESGEVDDLGLTTDDVDLTFSDSTVEGGGERYVVLLNGFDGGGALVDVDEAEVTDLLDVIGDAEFILRAEFADDESVVLVNTEDGVYLVPTDEPQEADRLGDGAGQLLEGDDAVLLTSADGAVVRDLDSGDEITVSDQPDGALAVGELVLVARDDEAVLLEPGSDDVLASAPYSNEGVAPVAVGDAVLVPGSDEPTWTLVDGGEATATELPDLDGLTPVFGGRPERWVPFSGEDEHVLVSLDTTDGSVVPLLDLDEEERIVGFPMVAGAGPAALVSTFDDDGTYARLLDLDTGEVQDLGSPVLGAAFSPDGSQIVWVIGPDAELRVGPVDDVEAAEVLDDGVAIPIWLADD
jgi:hypothetical protein